MRWGVILMAVSLVAGLLGFSRSAAGAPRPARALFVVAIVTFLVGLIAVLLGAAQD